MAKPKKIDQVHTNEKICFLFYGVVACAKDFKNNNDS